MVLLLLLSRIWESWSRHKGHGCGGGSSRLRRGRVEWVHGGVGGRHEVTRLVDNDPLRGLDKLLGSGQVRVRLGLRSGSWRGRCSGKAGQGRHG